MSTWAGHSSPRTHSPHRRYQPGKPRWLPRRRDRIPGPCDKHHLGLLYPYLSAYLSPTWALIGKYFFLNPQNPGPITTPSSRVITGHFYSFELFPVTGDGWCSPLPLLSTCHRLFNPSTSARSPHIFVLIIHQIWQPLLEICCQGVVSPLTLCQSVSLFLWVCHRVVLDRQGLFVSIRQVLGKYLVVWLNISLIFRTPSPILWQISVLMKFLDNILNKFIIKLVSLLNF